MTVLRTAKAKLERLPTTRSPHERGVAWLRFASNDGCLRWPDECRTISGGAKAVQSNRRTAEAQRQRA